MSELNNYKLNDEALDQVTGGNDGRSEYFSVRDISPRWVYRLWIYNPKGGECYGYIYKEYTERI